MLIRNKTNLDYSTIGMLIDKIMKHNTGNTAYYGKIEVCTMQVAIYKIKVQIRYLKRYTEWCFTELKGDKQKAG